MDWNTFVEDAPARVVEVIEDGPFPLKEYGGSKLTWTDKKRGMMRFKGGDGRGGKTSAKHGHVAVVYFDPSFCEGDFIPEGVPDEVTERHADRNVRQEFNKL